jgi:hypothetical protein
MQKNMPCHARRPQTCQVPALQVNNCCRYSFRVKFESRLLKRNFFSLFVCKKNPQRLNPGAVFFVRLRLLFDCVFCSTAAFVRLRLLFDCVFCSTASFVRLRLLFDCIFCSTASFVQLPLLFDCVFCTTAAFV